MTAYLGESDTVLFEERPVTTRVDVAAPPGDNGWYSWAKDLWRWMTGAITSLGGLAVSVSTIVALVVMVVRRQHPGADVDTGTTEGVRADGHRRGRCGRAIRVSAGHARGPLREGALGPAAGETRTVTPANDSPQHGEQSGRLWLSPGRRCGC
ncbi:hypothetical protein [Streptomyces mirabilis]|uniref:hypothetical protein n=1 Tax=Streptomyces mirabilis TaxID=68239 RepID=UPI0033B2C792